MTVRRPYVAGQFYTDDPEALAREVKDYLRPPGPYEKSAPVRARAVIAPHAGYMYSGTVAGAIYSVAEVPDDVILIGPNHTGLGQAVSVMTEGSWGLPTGEVEVNRELAEMVTASSDLFSADTDAHAREHSLEVQLPFIHARNPGARIVPITVMDADHQACLEMGSALAGVIRAWDRPVLIAVSSDMNHYESDEKTREKDKRAIEKVLDLDDGGLLDTAIAWNISMCGILPAAIAISAARDLGSTSGELVAYATSAEQSGDYSHVVGYAGILIR